MKSPSMRMTLEPLALAKYVTSQLNCLFQDQNTVDEGQIYDLLPSTLSRMEHCFSYINAKYFFDRGVCQFDHLNGDQYAMFLYLLSNAAFKGKTASGLAAKLYLLNKSLHGIDAFYEIELPSIFLFVHPVGTILGRATYRDFLMVYQHCSVGSNHNKYPDLGAFLTLHPGSSVLGSSHIGDNCAIAAGGLLIDENIAANRVYFGGPKNFSTKINASKQAIWRV